MSVETIKNLISLNRSRECSNMDKLYTFVLGGAGTGKTTLIRALAKEDELYHVVSFTNNSVNIITTEESERKLKKNIKTIHKTLKIFSVFDEQLNEIQVSKLVCCTNHKLIPIVGNAIPYEDLFACSHKALNMFNIDKYVDKFIIIDECSVVSHELFHLLNRLPCRGFIIFGDRDQIRPIDEDICLVCNKKSTSCRFDIFNYSTEINTINLTVNFRNSTGVMNRIQEFRQYGKLNMKRVNCKDLVASNTILDSPVLCYRNITVSYINRIFSANRQIPNPGEPIYFTTGTSKMIVSKLYKVQECSIVTVLDKVFGELGVIRFKIDDSEVFSIIDKDYLDRVLFRLLRELDNEPLTDALIQQRNSLIFRYREYINPWMFAYAITVHKAQGSTYDNAYIYMNDFSRTDQALKKQLIYTSLSRARNDVYNVLIPSKWVL